MIRLLNLTIVFLLLTLVGCTGRESQPTIDLNHEQYRTWHSFLGDKEASQYSSLHQITRENVNQLEIAWTFSTGDLVDGERTEIQANPLIIDGILYGTTPLKKAFALKADTSELLWETTLPAGGYATPSVYEVDGRQYVVIATGGGKMGTKSGDTYVAFSLPGNKP